MYFILQILNLKSTFKTLMNIYTNPAPRLTTIIYYYY